MSKSFRKDLTGQRFGRLTVLEFVPTKDGHSHWRCKCDCGNNKIIDGEHLKSNKIKSCGCLNKELSSERAYMRGKETYKHGCTTKQSRLYRIWSAMKERCLAHKHYGGRGIKVCDEWQNDFLKFRDWATLNGYNDNLTIDRIDVNGDYTPHNCRFASMHKQNRNKRNNVNVDYYGEILCLKEVSELSGIGYSTLRGRYKRGDRGERLFRPVKKNK